MTSISQVDPVVRRRIESYAAYILSASKPVGERRIGIEFEAIGYRKRDLRRIDAPLVQRVMEWFARESTAVEHEGETITAVSTPRGDISSEPGGQIEFSSRPKLRIAEIEADLKWFLQLLCAVTEREQLIFLSCGFDPLGGREEQYWIPKQRYAILRPFLEMRGQRGVDMMTRTGAAQVSLDYTGEADLCKLYLLGNRMAPFVGAMFANSPYEEGRISGCQSTRNRVWLRTDDARCGVAAVALRRPFRLAALIEAVLEVPTIMVRRDHGLVATHGKLLAEIEDQRFDDFLMLLSTVFTTARLRTYIEMRGADAGDPGDALALAAFWKGIAYDTTACDTALEMLPDLDCEGYAQLSEAAATEGLAGHARGVRVLPLAREFLQLAREGLARTAPDECSYLATLECRMADCMTPASLLLRNCGDNIASAVRALRIV